MKIPDCGCIGEKWDNFLCGVDTPESIGFIIDIFFNEDLSSVEDIELVLNFCPQCGKAYKEGT